jgi:hypothetical protein
MEFQFSTRYGGISFSSTLRDGVKGCRFKMIKYSHPEYWDAVYVPVTVEQEDSMMAKALEMADMPEGFACFMKVGTQKGKDLYWKQSDCSYGDNHIKYDLSGAAFSYWTKFKIWKPSKAKMVCNRACTEVVLAGEPRAMTLHIYDQRGTAKQADYASMTPSNTDAMFRNYFKKG